MTDHTHTTHDSKDRTNDFGDALCEARDALSAHSEDFDGTYRLPCHDGLASLRYIESGVQETIAHADENGITVVADFPEAGLHQGAIGVVAEHVPTHRPDEAADALEALGYHVRQTGPGKYRVARIEECEEITLGYWGRSTRVYDHCPMEVRESLHEHGYSVEPFRCATELRAKIDTERYTVDPCEQSRIIIKRDLDGTPLASVDTSDRSMTVYAEAMAREADHLSHGASALDLEVTRREPTVAAAE